MATTCCSLCDHLFKLTSALLPVGAFRRLPSCDIKAVQIVVLATKRDTSSSTHVGVYQLTFAPLLAYDAPLLPFYRENTKRPH